MSGKKTTNASRSWCVIDEWKVILFGKNRIIFSIGNKKKGCDKREDKIYHRLVWKCQTSDSTRVLFP